MNGRVTTRGTILYVHDRDGETGRERFQRSDWPDGTRTFRAVCELDDLGMVRDVTHTAGPDFRPIDAYARLQWADSWAAGWFRFGEREAICEALVPGFGRVSQRVELPERPRWFGTHPLCSDGWGSAAYDPARADEPVPGYVTSMLTTGSDGPLLMPYALDRLDDLGDEEIEVPAGPFACRHYRLVYRGGLVQDNWVDERFQLVRTRNDELESDYVLAELETLPT